MCVISPTSYQLIKTEQYITKAAAAGIDYGHNRYNCKDFIATYLYKAYGATTLATSYKSLEL